MNIFNHLHELGTIPPQTLCLFYHGDEILVLNQHEPWRLPSYQQLNITLQTKTVFFMETELGAVLVADLNTSSVPSPFSLENARSHYHLFDTPTRTTLAKTFGYLHWYRMHQFCGRCANATFMDAEEVAMVCPECHYHFYPKVNPSMIVLVHRGSEILLARSPYFAPEIYSTLAGYVAPGETLEQTVQREVKEEVNLEVKNIRYFGSQAWPFPNVLMLGFFAEYAAGTLQIDPKEIEAAGWFTAETLPPLPRKISIARQLIDTWLQQQ